MAACRCRLQAAALLASCRWIDAHRIREFHEKPKNPKPMPDDPHRALASMGIYVFNMDLLGRELLADHALAASSHDFGKDIIPRLIETHCVCAYRFGEETGRVTPDRYWRDVGTIDSYYAANMDLLAQVPPMNLYQHDWPIRTYNGQNPPARMGPGLTGTQGNSSTPCSVAGRSSAAARSGIRSCSLKSGWMKML